MKIALIFPLSLLAGCTAYSDAPPYAPPSPERLAEAIGGRVPEGPPLACIRQRELGGKTVIDGRTLLFEGPGSTAYLTRLGPGCESMRRWHAFRSRTISPQYCEGDLIIPFDPNSGVEYGACQLGRFQAFRRPR